MNFRKNMSFWIGGAVSAAVLAAAGYLVFRYQATYSKLNADLRQETDRLRGLNQGNPFPSKENIEILRKDADQLAAYLTKVQKTFQYDAVAPEMIEPAEFAVFLERNMKEIRRAASAGGTKIPESGSLALERYTKGELPNIEAIPRLVSQVKIIHELVDILAAEKVEEILDVQREMFESSIKAEVEGQEQPESAQQQRQFASSTATAGSSAMESMPHSESNDLFDVERVQVSFSANEHAVWEVINSLARSKMFAVVSHVEIHNGLVITVKPPQAPAAAPAPAATAQASSDIFGAAQPAAAPVEPVAAVVVPPREERVVAGREPIRVDLVVDVYRFTPPSEAPAKEEGGGA